jgi:hypothetical protein
MTAWGAPAPVVIDLGKSDTRKVLIGGSVAGGLGILALVGSVSAFLDGEPVGGTIAGIIGIAFTFIGVMAVVKWKTISRPRKLIIEQQGIRLDDPQGMPWAVGWQELGAISISRTRERAVQLADALVKRTLVRVDLHPRDPQRFRPAHPTMEPLWEFHRPDRPRPAHLRPADLPRRDRRGLHRRPPLNARGSLRAVRRLRGVPA